MFKLVKPFLLNRLKEPTTYVGLVAIIGGAFGVALSDEHAFNIASGVAVLVGALLAAHREAKSPDSAPALRAAGDAAVDERLRGNEPAADLPAEGQHRTSDSDPKQPRAVHRGKGR